MKITRIDRSKIGHVQQCKLKVYQMLSNAYQSSIGLNFRIQESFSGIRNSEGLRTYPYHWPWPAVGRPLVDSTLFADRRVAHKFEPPEVEEV